MDHRAAEQQTPLMGPLGPTGQPGRPSVWNRPEFVSDWPMLKARIVRGEISLYEAAKRSGVSRATLRRILNG
jgi:hypothetical protein